MLGFIGGRMAPGTSDFLKPPLSHCGWPAASSLRLSKISRLPRWIPISWVTWRSLAMRLIPVFAIQTRYLSSHIIPRDTESKFIEKKFIEDEIPASQFRNWFPNPLQHSSSNHQAPTTLSSVSNDPELMRGWQIGYIGYDHTSDFQSPNPLVLIRTTTYVRPSWGLISRPRLP